MCIRVCLADGHGIAPFYKQYASCINIFVKMETVSIIYEVYSCLLGRYASHAGQHPSTSMYMFLAVVVGARYIVRGFTVDCEVIILDC